MTGFEYLLFAVTVTGWSASWYAIILQLGVVAPEVSLVWRFAIAGAATFAWAYLRGERLVHPLRTHLRFALLGALLFSGNFLSFYYGGLATPSGLMAVVFSLAPLINLVLARPLLGHKIQARMAVGALLGFAGVFLMFSPRVLASGLDRAALGGFLLCLQGTLIFCLGNMLSAATQRAGIPVLPASAWGMTYGTLWLALFAALGGREFTIEPTPAYLGSLALLALLASVLTFAAYLTLLGRVGPARASFVTVVSPVLALLISTALEGYVWTLPAFAGLALVLAGNVIVLRPRL